MSDQQLLERASAAYIALLRIPVTSALRTKMQGAMAELRDTLAEGTGITSEEAQRAFERIACGPVEPHRRAQPDQYSARRRATTNSPE